MKMKNILTIAFVSILSAVVAVGLFKVFGGDKVIYNVTPDDKGVETVSFKEDLGAKPFDFVYAAEKGLPAVVHIRSTVGKNESQDESSQMRRQQPRSMDDFWEEFFGSPFQNRRTPRKQMPQVGFGSGVIISPDGYIVTNNHVIDGATEIKVTFYNSEIVDAELIGTDPTTDVALIKVDKENLKYLQFADSDETKVGEWVAAIGNPAVGGDAYTLKSTVTAGIVSAIGRNIGINREELAIESFIQTDAVINRGNSGGALVDHKGDLIGINTAISTPTGVYAGYGFAVPANLVKKVITDLKEYGEVKRALLGVQYQDIEMVKSRGGEIQTNEKEGLYVAQVSEGGAAAKAGLKKGDVLIRVDDKPVTEGEQNKLQEIIGRKRPGDVVKIDFVRDGKRKSTSAKLLSAEETSENYKSVKNVTYFEDLGLELEDLSTQQKEELSIDGGVRVKNIDRNGILYRRSYGDITTGFVITNINGRSVNDMSTAKNALKQTSRGSVRIEGFNEKDPSSRFVYTFPIQ